MGGGGTPLCTYAYVAPHSEVRHTIGLEVEAWRNPHVEDQRRMPAILEAAVSAPDKETDLLYNSIIEEGVGEILTSKCIMGIKN